MSEAKEITVKIKDDEKSMKHKFLIYDDFVLTDQDPIIQDCIKQVLTEFNGQPESIKISILMVIL